MSVGQISVVSEWAPAKLNLSLRVVGRRPDGYHELESVMIPIALADRVTVTRLPEQQVRVSCQTVTPLPGAHTIPDNEGNIAWRAAVALGEHVGWRSGVSIDIEKRIPVAAGLAGGSANAAAVLRGLARLWQLPVGATELAALGAKIGADVPFCVVGKAAFATGVGEQLRPLPLGGPLWLVLANPGVALSTGEIFARWRSGIEGPAVRAAWPRATTAAGDPASPAALAAALERADWVTVGRLLWNDLERPALALCPQISHLKEKLLQTGALGAAMTGSGATVYGLFASEAAASRAYLAIRDLAPWAWFGTGG